jgi:hypothetical protein
MKNRIMLPLIIVLTNQLGCYHAFKLGNPSVTGVAMSPANRCEPTGMAYYLPKPLLVVAKNTRHVDEKKVGLTGAAPIPGGFDNQAAYADLRANVTSPGSKVAESRKANVEDPAADQRGIKQGELLIPNYEELLVPPQDSGLNKDSFFTYQIVFIPDLTQKYGMRMHGGSGEMRAALNLVNGWMHTGMGPYYVKDSSTAQNVMAIGVSTMFAGRGVADVVKSVGDLDGLVKAARESQPRDPLSNPELTHAIRELAEVLRRQRPVPQEIINYAEVYVYEPILLSQGETEWRLIADHHFNRQYLQANTDKNSSAALKELLEKFTAP